MATGGKRGGGEGAGTRFAWRGKTQKWGKKREGKKYGKTSKCHEMTRVYLRLLYVPIMQTNESVTGTITFG